jgi:hypothetical protein
MVAKAPAPAKPADAAPPEPGPAPAPPPKKEETPKLPTPYYKGLPDCDIIIDHYRVKGPSRWKEGYKCQYIRRSCVPTMGHGGWTYDYTKHRPQCPIRNGRAGMPEDADNFVRWVYTKGYTEVARGGFTYPYELRGSDAAWAAGAEGDLRTRLPFINAYATWSRPQVSTKGHQRMINAGFSPTPGWGMRWQPPSEWQPSSSVPTGGGFRPCKGG